MGFWDQLATQASVVDSSESRVAQITEDGELLQGEYENAVQLARTLKFTGSEKRYDVLLAPNMVYGDLIEAFCVENNAFIETMNIATLSMSENNVFSLQNLLEGGYIGEMNLMLSGFFFSHERAKLVPLIKNELGKFKGFNFIVAATHTKVVTMKTKGGKCLTFQGSANLRSSDNIEQLTIEDNTQVFDFHNKWFNAIKEDYEDIKISTEAGRRGKKLWSIITNK